MTTNTPAAAADGRAPRKFDNFAARISGALPADPTQLAALSPAHIDKRMGDHQAKRSPAARTAVSASSQPPAVTTPVQAASSYSETPEWLRNEMRSYFASKAAGQAGSVGKTAVTTVAAGATSKRTSAERWERANAKIENERRIQA